MFSLPHGAIYVEELISFLILIISLDWTSLTRNYMF